MAVKIIIRRKVPKDKETQLAPLLVELRSKAISQPGYIAGETLRNVENPEDYVVISTWQSTDTWKAWEANEERKGMAERIDSLLGQTTEYGIYYYS